MTSETSLYLSITITVLYFVFLSICSSVLGSLLVSYLWASFDERRTDLGSRPAESPTLQVGLDR